MPNQNQLGIPIKSAIFKVILLGMWFFMKVKLVCDNIKLSILLNMLAASLSSVLGKGSSKKPMPFITFHIKYRVANEATARCHKTFFLPQKFQYLHREKEKKVWSTVFAIFHYVRANQNESFHSHVEHSSWYLNIRLSRWISTHCFAQFFCIFSINLKVSRFRISIVL